MKKIKWISLIVCIAICELAGIIGSVFTVQNIPTWYATLNKPSFNPPNYLFGPVWITLYALIGISLYLIWNKKSKMKNIALTIFGVQLTLNAIWSILFFGMQQLLTALIELIALDIAIISTIIIFYKIEKKAAYILIPYLLWCLFATFLNYNIWMLNL